MLGFWVWWVLNFIIGWFVVVVMICCVLVVIRDWWFKMLSS